MSSKLVTVADRLSAQELSRFREMVESDQFATLTERIKAVLERKREELEREIPPDFTRGYIAALRLVLGMPQRIIEESKPKA